MFRIVFLVLLLFSCSDEQIIPRPIVENGVIDVQNWDLDTQGELELQGKWQLLEVGKSKTDANETFPVPGLFLENPLTQNFPNNLGEIAIGLEIKFPKIVDSASLMIPGNQSNKMSCQSDKGITVLSGRINYKDTETHKVLSPYILNLPQGQAFFCTWKIEIYQEEFKNGMNGIWASPILGSTGRIHAKFDLNRMYFSGMVGFLFSIGAYFFVQWILRKDDYRPLAVCFSNISMGVLMYYFGDLPVNNQDTHSILHTRIEFSMIPLIGVSIQFVIFTFSKLKVYTWVYYWSAIQVLVSLVNFVIPADYLQYSLILGEVVIVVSMLFISFLLARWYFIATSLWHEKLLIWSLISPLIFGGIDLIANRFFQKNLGISPLGMIVFVCALALSIARRTAKARRQAEEYALALSETNYSLQKFVPTEFLKELGLNNVTEAELGKAKSKVMTVLFSDLRGFTSISEQLTPEETFQFLNHYLSKLGPKIREFNGFIDKYIGDAIMALYTGSSADALDSALSMLREIRTLQKSETYPNVTLGIGIHKGSVIMGTIGEEKRFEATVISDAVNLTSRIESFTKSLGVDLLVSSISYLELREDQRKYTRWVGSFNVKGKQQDIHLYEVYTLDKEETRELKFRNKDSIHQIIQRLIQKRNTDQCIEEFQEILKNGRDSVIEWWVSHLESSRDKRRFPLNETGAVVLKDK
jgi:class 3 adenylate cyclase